MWNAWRARATRRRECSLRERLAALSRSSRAARAARSTAAPEGAPARGFNNKPSRPSIERHLPRAARRHHCAPPPQPPGRRRRPPVRPPPPVRRPPPRRRRRAPPDPPMSATILVEPPLALPAIDRRISRDSTVPKEVFKTLKEMPRPKLEDYAVGAVLGTGTFGTVFVAERRARSAASRAAARARAPPPPPRARPPLHHPRAAAARTARDPGDGRQVRPEAPREGVLRRRGQVAPGPRRAGHPLRAAPPLRRRPARLLPGRGPPLPRPRLRRGRGARAGRDRASAFPTRPPPRRRRALRLPQGRGPRPRGRGPLLRRPVRAALRLPPRPRRRLPRPQAREFAVGRPRLPQAHRLLLRQARRARVQDLHALRHARARTAGAEAAVFAREVLS